jgi:hypothetical protein
VNASDRPDPEAANTLSVTFRKQMEEQIHQTWAMQGQDHCYAAAHSQLMRKEAQPDGVVSLEVEECL